MNIDGRTPRDPGKDGAALKRQSDPSTIAVEQTGGEIRILVAQRTNEITDAIVAIEKDSLAKYGLEERAIRRLAESKKLQYRTIGRRRVTSLRWLLECLYSLPATPTAGVTDDIAEAARKRAARRAR